MLKIGLKKSENLDLGPWALIQFFDFGLKFAGGLTTAK